jgi:DNA-binding IclR family transcriptional regulator
VARPLTDGAFKIAAAMLVLSRDGARWLGLIEVAETSGMTQGRARQFLGELVRAGVITRQKRLEYRNGQPTARNRYALAVIA